MIACGKGMEGGVVNKGLFSGTLALHKRVLLAGTARDRIRPCHAIRVISKVLPDLENAAHVQAHQGSVAGPENRR